MSQALTMLLTEDEHELISLLGRAANLFSRVASGPVKSDQYEFVSRIHDLQWRVMGQAAARAFPQRYRLLGSVGDWTRT